jgi:SAM-dependent methyltransferase
VTQDDGRTVRDTTSAGYTNRLRARSEVWWKRLLPVQAPYRWNLRRQGLGKTIDLGCGIGRNLVALDPGSIGIDHNPDSVALCRERGLTALTPQEWQSSDHRRLESFDGLLLAHVVEHLTPQAGRDLVAEYLPYLRPGGRVFFVCPQERGYASDPSHVFFADGAHLTALAVGLGLRPERWRSFPLPRAAGSAFVYNEFCLLAHKS